MREIENKREGEGEREEKNGERKKERERWGGRGIEECGNLTTSLFFQV